MDGSLPAQQAGRRITVDDRSSQFCPSCHIAVAPYARQVRVGTQRAAEGVVILLIRARYHFECYIARLVEAVRVKIEELIEKARILFYDPATRRRIVLA